VNVFFSALACLARSGQKVVKQLFLVVIDYLLLNVWIK